MKHFFKLSLIALLTLYFVDINAQRGVRIGYIDMEYILENIPEHQEAKTQLDGRVQRWRQDIERLQNDIEQMKLNLSNDRVLLTRELIEDREEDIKIKEQELFQYQQARFGPNGDLVAQRRQLVQPIQDQVFAAVQEIAEARNYDFIFDKSADVVMLYAAQRNDISDQVVRIINRAARRTQAESREDRRAIRDRDNVSEEQDQRLQEREAIREQREAEREAIRQERIRVRDSIQAARQAEQDARRRPNQQTPSAQNNESGSQTREDALEERRRQQDSIRQARILEQEERRNRVLEERQRRQDSIRAARGQTNTPGTP